MPKTALANVSGVSKGGRCGSCPREPGTLTCPHDSRGGEETGPGTGPGTLPGGEPLPPDRAVGGARGGDNVPLHCAEDPRDGGAKEPPSAAASQAPEPAGALPPGGDVAPDLRPAATPGR